MSRTEASAAAVRYWLDKAREALASARSEEQANRLSFALNRAYYAAFYAASALLLQRGHRFAKHSGVRSAVHRHLVKPGLLPTEWGRFYDRLFEERQQGDYVELVSFDGEEVRSAVEKSTELVLLLERLAAGPPVDRT